MVVADLAIHVSNAAVALGGPIELANLRHPKTLHEGFPNTGAQSISHSKPYFVLLLSWPHGLRQEVAADFPNILHHLQAEGRKKKILLFKTSWFMNNFKKTIINAILMKSIGAYSAVVLHTIFPEAAGREFFLHYNSEAVDQTLANSNNVSWKEKKTWSNLEGETVVIKNL